MTRVPVPPHADATPAQRDGDGRSAPLAKSKASSDAASPPPETPARGGLLPLLQEIERRLDYCPICKGRTGQHWTPDNRTGHGASCDFGRALAAPPPGKGGVPVEELERFIATLDDDLPITKVSSVQLGGWEDAFDHVKCRLRSLVESASSSGRGPHDHP